ncbi:MAG TPA: ABC transporter substrate-binding protein [Reyranella sp.]|nr:ABC transporter substrate-binding protein [Reyranella sp.]
MRSLLFGVVSFGAMIAAFVMPAVSAAPKTDPVDLVRTVAVDLTEAVKAAPGAPREAAMRSVLQREFDLPYIASATMGTHWNEASLDQQARILAAVETTEARSYAQRLGTYPGATITVGTATVGANGSWIVASSLNLPSGQSVRLAWEVHVAPQGLRVADVKVEGVSLFTTKRTAYDSYIRSHGGTVEPLVQVLEAHASR